MTLFFVLVIISFIFLLVEFLTTSNCVKKIPLRILVNGTRGKSSVTNYIAAGLRTADKKTMAKITGIIPTIIYPDRSSKIIKRIGPARIQEQFKIIRKASKLSVDCLILECMSITPELQKLESKIFKPNIYVITNIRNDHQEQMGDEEDQVNAICDSIPLNSTVITGEKKYLNQIEISAKMKNSSVVYAADDFDFKNIDVPANVFKSNILIALSACKAAKVENAESDKSVLEMIKNSEEALFEFSYADKKIKFLNGFAVNDVSSAQEFIEYWENKIDRFNHLNFIFNSRSDRPLRSIAFAKWFGRIKNLNRIIITGNHIPRTKLELIRNGIESKKIVIWKKSKIENAKVSLIQIADPVSNFIGLGNIAGDGLLFIDSLKKNAQPRTVNVN